MINRLSYYARLTVDADKWTTVDSGEVYDFLECVGFSYSDFLRAL